MPLNDRWIPAHQEWRYECDGAGCDVGLRVSGPSAADRPEGYFVQVRRVTAAHKHTEAPAELFFHDKACLVNAVQYQLSALLTSEIDPTQEV